jgi:hypothetical protein
LAGLDAGDSTPVSIVDDPAGQRRDNQGGKRIERAADHHHLCSITTEIRSGTSIIVNVSTAFPRPQRLSVWTNEVWPPVVLSVGSSPST